LKPLKEFSGEGGAPAPAWSFLAFQTLLKAIFLDRGQVNDYIFGKKLRLSATN
jgi:hypothetical protein